MPVLLVVVKLDITLKRNYITLGVLEEELLYPLNEYRNTSLSENLEE
jgi:hypothetical protein